MSAGRRTPTHFGVITDYEYNSTHKRERVTVWSGSFYSVWEADGLSLPGRDGYMLTTYNGDRVRVECALRSDETWEVVDAAISAALSAHYERTGVVQLVRS